jgi:hypothetical protein
MSPSALRKRSFDANRLLELHRKRQAAEFKSEASSERQTALQQLGLGSTVRGSAAANTNEMAFEARPSRGLGSALEGTAA